MKGVFDAIVGWALLNVAIIGIGLIPQRYWLSF